MATSNAQSVFAGKEMKNVAEDWIRRQVGKQDQQKRTLSKSPDGGSVKPPKKVFLNSELNIIRKRVEFKNIFGKEYSLNTPAKEISVTLPKRKMKQLPQLVIESIETTQDYKGLQNLYITNEKGFQSRVENFILLRWSLVGDRVHCVLEQYQSQTSTDSEGSLVCIATFEIIPATDPLPELEFDEHDITRNGEHHGPILKLNLEELRKRIENAAFQDDLRLAKPKPVTPPESGEDKPPTGDCDSGYESASPSESSATDPKLPSTPLEISRSILNLIDVLQLDEVYPPRRLKDIARRIAKNLSPTIDSLGLPRTRRTAEQLIKINMFETFFYLDDSSSMKQGRPKSRYDMQKEAVRRLAPLATKLIGNKLHLRYINNNSDELFNDLKADDIASKLDSVNVGGGTKIGTVLEKKIVKPLMEKLRLKKFEAPVVVTIITDGEPRRENRDKLKNVISSCKEFLNRDQNREWGFSAVIFQIHYVGTDQGAQDYIEELQEECGDILFCNTEPLDNIMEGTTREERNKDLLNLADKAIMEVTKKGRTGKRSS